MAKAACSRCGGSEAGTRSWASALLRSAGLRAGSFFFLLKETARLRSRLGCGHAAAVILLPVFADLDVGCAGGAAIEVRAFESRQVQFDDRFDTVGAHVRGEVVEVRHLAGDVMDPGAALLDHLGIDVVLSAGRDYFDLILAVFARRSHRYLLLER